jgi:hypothetical protein
MTSVDEQPAQEKKFPFKIWAVLIVLGGLQSIASPFLASSLDIELTTYVLIRSVVLGILSLAVGVGFWLERKWALWTYIGLLVFSFINLSIVASQGLVPVWQAICSGLVGIIFLIFFISQRHQFK